LQALRRNFDAAVAPVSPHPAVSHDYAHLKNYNESASLGVHLTDGPAVGIDNPVTLAMVRAKLDTIEIAVGLSDYGSTPAYERGAVALCRNAIAAIDNALRNPAAPTAP